MLLTASLVRAVNRFTRMRRILQLDETDGIGYSYFIG